MNTEERTFKLWEYQVSHGQLLIRSPKSPATAGLPEQRTNLDLVFLGVEYMSVPRIFRGISVSSPTPDEIRLLSDITEHQLDLETVRILVSHDKRFPIVAAGFAISENDWDIFDSPFEFRSQFRATSR